LSRDLVEHFRNLLVARLANEKGAIDSENALPMQALDLPDQEVAELAAQVKDVAVDMLLDYFDFMISGDESVGRLATPRFALEATLIRLATLPKTVPVAQLVERLEKLTRSTDSRSASAAPARPAPAMAPAPNPVASLAPAAVKAAAPAPSETIMSAPGAPSPVLWQEFVTFVGREKKFLAANLQSGQPLELSNGELQIGVAEKHHLHYLQDPENLAALRSLAQQFFTPDISVKIAAAAGTRETISYDQAPSPMGGEQGNDMVKEALRIFGGSVRTVRRDNQ
jgi:hypothetical protein